MNYHAYIDQSKRRPYRCGHPGCGRDITHPFHQPPLPGTVIVPPPAPPRFDYWGGTEPAEPKRDPPQMGLFA